MKKTLLFLFATFYVCAQEPSVNWSGRIGGIGYDSALGLHVDATGNFYITGGFQGLSVDFDFQSGTFPMTGNSADTYLVKYNNNGGLLWAAQFGGNFNSFGKGIATDSAFNVHSAGEFQATVDFNPGPGVFNMSAVTSPFAYSDVYLSKLNANGGFIHAKQIKGSGGSKGVTAYALDQAGNSHLAGYFSSSTDFGGVSLTPAGGTANTIYDMYIARYGSNGTLSWVKQFVVNDVSQRAESMAVDAGGNLYLCGQFYQAVDFDPGPVNTAILTPHTIGALEVFILKLDPNGNFLWAKQIGGTHSNSANDMVLDGLGNMYLTGSYFGTVDFDPGNGTHSVSTPVNSGYYGYVLKLDTDGNFIWVKSLLGNSRGNSITMAPSGKIAITGVFHNTCDFSGGAGSAIRTTAGSSDAFMAEFNANGDFNWVKCFGGTGEEEGEEIASDPAGNYFAFGSFQNTAVMNTAMDSFSLTSNGSSDLYILKLGNALNAPDFEQQGLSVYPNPCRDQLHLTLSDDFAGGDYYVYSLSGQLLKTGPVGRALMTEGLASGSYLLKVIETGGISRQRMFLKE